MGRSCLQLPAPAVTACRGLTFPVHSSILRLMLAPPCENRSRPTLQDSNKLLSFASSAQPASPRAGADSTEEPPGGPEPASSAWCEPGHGS